MRPQSAISRSSMFLHRPRLRTSSALNSELIVIWSPVLQDPPDLRVYVRHMSST